MLKEVEEIKGRISDVARRQREVNAKLDRLLAKDASAPVTLDMPNNLVLPLESMEAINLLEGQLTDKQFAEAVVSLNSFITQIKLSYCITMPVCACE